MALGSTQSLTEMSSRSISWGQRRPVCKGDNLTTILCHCHEIWPLQTCNRTALPLLHQVIALQGKQGTNVKINLLPPLSGLVVETAQYATILCVRVKFFQLQSVCGKNTNSVEYHVSIFFFLLHSILDISSILIRPVLLY